MQEVLGGLHHPHGPWQGFESQELLDKQLLGRSDVLSFVTKDAGPAPAARRLV